MKHCPLFVKAFVGLMLTSAVLHLTTLAVYFLMTHDSVPLNFFSIIGFNLFFPELVYSKFANSYSFIATSALYGIILFFLYEKNCRTR